MARLAFGMARLAFGMARLASGMARLAREHSPANGCHESIGDGELRFRQTRRDTSADHVQRSRPHPFDVFGEVQGLRQQGVAGHRIVRNAQLLQGQRRQQPARVPNLQAIREKHHLYAAVARVVAVRYRVDDGFGDDLRGNLISPGRADALRPRTHRPVDLAEHEVHGLIDQLEHRALVDLIRGDRLLDLRSVKARALDLGGDQEPLGRLPEQQYGGIGQPPLVQQVQMLQQPLGGNVLRQREVPGSARDADEEGHPLAVEIIQRRILADRRVEGSPTEQFPDFQVLHQRGVDPGLQFFQGVEPLSDQPGLSLADQRPHLRVPCAIFCALHENEAMHAESGRAVELPLRRRNPRFVFAPIPPAEQPDVEVAPLDFVQIEFVRPLIRRRCVLEEEHVEETPQQRIFVHIVTQRLALLRELALHAADEDADGDHALSRSVWNPTANAFISRGCRPGSRRFAGGWKSGWSIAFRTHR